MIDQKTLRQVIRCAPDGRGRNQVERLARFIGVDDESSNSDLVADVAATVRRLALRDALGDGGAS